MFVPNHERHKQDHCPLINVILDKPIYPVRTIYIKGELCMQTYTNMRNGHVDTTQDDLAVITHIFGSLHGGVAAMCL